MAFTDELAREICRRIRSRCSVSYVTFGEILPGVEDGSFDLGFGNFLRAPKREKWAVVLRARGGMGNHF